MKVGCWGWFVVFSHLIIGRWGPTVGGGAVSWRRVELLAVSLHPCVFAVRLRYVSREGDEVYGMWTHLLLAAPPRFPLQFLLPQATARPAEGGAEHDGEAEPQDAQEDPRRGAGGRGRWKTQKKRNYNPFLCKKDIITHDTFMSFWMSLVLY